MHRLISVYSSSVKQLKAGQQNEEFDKKLFFF